MELTWQMYAIVCPLVFLAGLIDSIAGGGGLISLPAYYLAGLPPTGEIDKRTWKDLALYYALAADQLENIGGK